MKWMCCLLLSFCFANAGDEALLAQAKAFFKPIPKQMPGSERDAQSLIELGKELYFETALSINDSQSCNSCHRVDEKLGGVDNTKFSPGAEGKLGGRNAPTVLNAGFHVAQFWDGRAADLVAQAKGPILNPVEMGLPDEATAVKKISSMAKYKKLFTNTYKNGEVTYQRIAEAIAAFERTLVTHDRFDDFLNGDASALTEQEKQGLSTFMAKGCTACHTGALLGGHMFQKVGLIKPYANQDDLGRYEVTKNEADKYVFKVPSLRNIALTAPYFHDGGAATLADAVTTMAEIQLGQDLSKQEVEDMVAFLKSLTDKARVD